MFSGMIKYTCNNLEGNFVIRRASAALGLTDEIVMTLLEIFKDSGMIKILSRDEESYKINFVESIELSKTLHTQKYAEFVELLNTVNDYKMSFLKMPL